MITYHVEPMVRNIPQLETLISLHWEEIAGYRDTIKLAPDWGKYQKMEDDGIITMFTVRDEGVMVGYSIFMTFPLLHYREVEAASNDVIYLHPEYRRGMAGYKLIKMCHEHFLALGVKRILWHLKPQSDWSRILERLGYRFEEKIMGIHTGR